MKKALFVLLLSIAAVQVYAQNAKKTPPPVREYTPDQLRLAPREISVPAVENPFGLTAPQRKALAPFVKNAPAVSGVKTVTGDQGLPIFWQGVPADYFENSSLDPGSRAQAYLNALQPAGIKEPAREFSVSAIQTDEQGNWHVRMQQQWSGVPVYGAELVAHSQNGVFAMLNGRYFSTPQVESPIPALNANAAIDQVKRHIGADKIKKDWSDFDLMVVGGQAFKTALVVYFQEGTASNARLAWHVEAHPNLLSRVVYFIDAQNGEILHQYNHVCSIHPALEGQTAIHHHEEAAGDAIVFEPFALVGPVTGNGLDLLDTARTFGAWDAGSNQFYLEDASKPMFNAGASTMPLDPSGAIITLNALNTSPESQSNFDYNFVVSGSTNFSDKGAVSTHHNSIKSYDYFKNKFNRNSIDGVGGNIIAFYNVSEDDGSSMENAYWNGAAMWYGNGGSTFKKLARGLDVGGHEMTHGVVEKTANLEYQNESGALNESFADIFGAMIDRADWKIGEDVMQSGVNPNNALRDLQDPHNGVSSSSPWWQPRILSEKYVGSQDNGGVHINSGIANYAFYLFASNGVVGKDKAEQVYYKALRDYLVKSSKFIDCRLAVIQAATDLYGAAVANAAASAFTQVGIQGSQPGGNYLGQLSTNPGDDYILCVSEDDQKINLAVENGQVLGTLYNGGVQSRPSISDNGAQVVFVNTIGHIVTVDLVYTPTQIIPTVNPEFSASPVWRNAAISKDGRFLAAITNNQDNRVYIWDLSDPFSFDPETFFLVNPTYSQSPTNTGEVRYADVLEFDYSGTSLMYDAYNELSNQQGEDLSYWDIGFLEFWKNGQFVNTQNPFISKLFSGLPENISVGNPAFAKNSPFIIAFDVIDAANDNYDIYAANTETGDFGALVTDNGGLGWPNFSRLDDRIIFERPFVSGGYDLFQQGIKPSKIEPQGNEAGFIDFHQWGVWYGNGTRSLILSTAQVDGAQLSQVSVAPNPTVDRAVLSVQSKSTTDALCTVVDMMGRSVLSQVYTLQTGENQVELNLESLVSGTYLVRLQTTQGSSVTLKVVRQ
jgi:bacillolysin